VIDVITFVGCFVFAVFVSFAKDIGAWLNRRAARKTLRLLHATAYWATEREMCE
jgi:hypothetical protein